MNSEINKNPATATGSVQPTVDIDDYIDSPFEDDLKHLDALFRIAGRHNVLSMPPEGMLYLGGQSSILELDPTVESKCTFSICDEALDQLRQISLEVDAWVSGVEEKQDGEIPIVYDLHYDGAITYIVARSLGAPNPFEDARTILRGIRTDKETLAHIFHQDSINNPFKDYYSWTIFVEISSRKSERLEVPATFIGVDLIATDDDLVLRIQLPSPDALEQAGLGWLWYYHDCCETNYSNKTPWLSERVCDCPRPY